MKSARDAGIICHYCSDTEFAGEPSSPTEEYKGLKAKATHAMLKGISKSVKAML